MSIILTASPAGFDRHSAYLAALYGPNIRPLPCPRPLIEAALLAHAGPGLVRAAEQRPDAIDSCRSLDRVVLTLWAGLIAIGLRSPAPPCDRISPSALRCWQRRITFVSLTFLKIATAAATLRRPQIDPPPLETGDLPTISVLVACMARRRLPPA